MNVPADQVSTPTYNQDLVRTAVDLVAAQAHGIFHVCGPELLPRIDFARQVLTFFGLDHHNLRPIPTAELGQRAPRPLSAGLLTQKLAAEHPSLRMRPLAEALADCEPELRAFFEQQQALRGAGGD